MATVNAKMLSGMFGITVQRVHQLVKEGLPKENRGSYDLLKSVRWYIRYLHSALEKRAVPVAGGGFADEREERIRLLRAEADLKEIELAKQRAQFVAIPDVEAMLTDLVLTTKARIMAIAPRVAPDLVGEMSRVMIHAKIEKVCKEALEYLAKAGGNGRITKLSNSSS